MPDISITIPCYLLPDKDCELLRFTQNCIQSIRTFVPEFELILVDNGSVVGAPYLRSQADVYIMNPHNLGFAPAVNQGLKIARGEWLVVCNNDVELLDDWPAAAIAAWQVGTGAVSSHLHDHDPEHQAGRQTVTGGMMFGALWMTHRDVIREVGYLDEEFRFGMFEDKDFWIRLTLSNYELVKAGWCKHTGNATWGKLPYQEQIYLENRARFEAKWGCLLGQ